MSVVVDSHAYNVPMVRLSEKCDIYWKMKQFFSASKHHIQAECRLFSHACRMFRHGRRY